MTKITRYDFSATKAYGMEDNESIVQLHDGWGSYVPIVMEFSTLPAPLVKFSTKIHPPTEPISEGNSILGWALS